MTCFLHSYETICFEKLCLNISFLRDHLYACDIYISGKINSYGHTNKNVKELIQGSYNLNVMSSNDFTIDAVKAISIMGSKLFIYVHDKGEIDDKEVKFAKKCNKLMIRLSNFQSKSDKFGISIVIDDKFTKELLTKINNLLKIENFKIQLPSDEHLLSLKSEGNLCQVAYRRDTESLFYITELIEQCNGSKRHVKLLKEWSMQKQILTEFEIKNCSLVCIDNRHKMIYVFNEDEKVVEKYDGNYKLNGQSEKINNYEITSMTVNEVNQNVYLISLKNNVLLRLNVYLKLNEKKPLYSPDQIVCSNNGYLYVMCIYRTYDDSYLQKLRFSDRVTRVFNCEDYIRVFEGDRLKYIRRIDLNRVSCSLICVSKERETDNTPPRYVYAIGRVIDNRNLASFYSYYFKFNFQGTLLEKVCLNKLSITCFTIIDSENEIFICNRGKKFIKLKFYNKQSLKKRLLV